MATSAVSSLEDFLKVSDDGDKKMKEPEKDVKKPEDNPNPEDKKDLQPPSDGKDIKDPDKKTDKQPVKGDKETNLANLRKKAESLEERLKVYSELLPEDKIDDFRKLSEDLFDGDIFSAQDTLSSLNDRIKTFEENENSLSEQLKKREAEISSMNIERDSHYIDNFVTPINEERELLFANVADIENGKIKHPDLINQLVRSFFDEKGNQISITSMKEVMTKFKEIYEEKTGEGYDIPDISTVHKNIKNLINLKSKRDEAVSNWENEKQNQERAALDAQEKQIAQNKKAIIDRATSAGEIFKSSLDKADFSFLGDKFEDTVDESMGTLVKRLSGEDIPGYEEMADNSFKIAAYPTLKEAYDSVLKELEELKSKLKEEDDDKGGSPPPGSSKDKELRGSSALDLLKPSR